MPTRKLKPEEIAARREAADGYWATKTRLEVELGTKVNDAKLVRAQIREAMSYFSDLQREILSGEVEVDPQGKLI